MDIRLPLVTVLIICTFTACTIDQNSPPEKPNVVLILTDDQGYGDVSIHGNDIIETPVLDKLGSNSLRLDNFYVSPVCAPTRASLLTGKYHLRTGTTWVTRNAEMMRSEELTLAEVLKADGYVTGCFGKWHNGAHYPTDPVGQGFDSFTGFKAGHFTNYFNPVLDHQGGKKQFEGYITDIITDQALAFIEENKDTAFFCYIPYNAPHSPYIVPEPYYEKYANQGLDERLATVYGMVENVDANIGRIIAALEDRKLSEKTILLFITDNGPQFDRYNDNMKGRKGWVNDGGVRVPAFIQWKGQIKPGISDQLSAHIDIMPTLLKLTGSSSLVPDDMDGMDLSAVLKERFYPGPRTIFTHYNYRDGKIPPYPGAVRNDSLRLVIGRDSAHLLTRLTEDRDESEDLTDMYSTIAREMRMMYDGWFNKVRAGIGVDEIPIGYQEVPQIVLNAHEAHLAGNIITYKFSRFGWAHDWIVNWSSNKDTITWKVDCHQKSVYNVQIKYTCSPEWTGSDITLSIDGKVSLNFPVEKPFEPELIPNRDRFPREQEAVEQTWGTLDIGEVSMDAGSHTIRLIARKVQSRQVGELKALVLNRVDN